MSNTISGPGSISGSGNFMGESAPTFNRTLSISTVNLNDVGYDAQFTNNTMFFNTSFPPYLTDYMPESTPLLITVSGLVSVEAMNGQTFTVMRANQTIVDVSGFAAFISTFSLNGTHAYENYDHTWNWNS